MLFTTLIEIYVLEADMYHLETYEGAFAVGTEYGLRSKSIVPPCGRRALELHSNLLPFIGGATRNSSGGIIKPYNVREYKYVSCFCDTMKMVFCNAYTECQLKHYLKCI